MRKPLLLSLLILFMFSISFGQHANRFSQGDILDDLHMLQKAIPKAHFNAYTAISKTAFNQHCHNIQKKITQDSIKALDAVGYYQKIISKINTGHAEIDFPINIYRNYVVNGGTVLPFEIAIENSIPYVRSFYGSHPDIHLGDEIESINGIPITTVLAQIHPHLSAERLYFKNAKLEYWSLPRLYWQVFGEEKTFNIKLCHNHVEKQLTLPSIRALEDFEYIRKDIISSDRRLTYKNDIPILHPGGFSSLDENGIEDFKKFIDSSFADIKKRESKTLIIDLRNNSGGDNVYSDYLVSYIASEPFKWNSSFQLKTSALLKAQTRKYQDTSDNYFKEILQHKDGTIYTYTHPPVKPASASLRFQGSVYVLINRQSHSMAAVTAALIQDYKFATIVGEETGDFPSLHAAQFSFQLPKTGITVKLPKGYMIRPNGSQAPMGVIPDISIDDHLIDKEDEILETLLHKISKT